VPRFNSDGVEIAYEVEGEAKPVLLIHGFASSAQVNWRSTSWIKMLIAAGYQPITFDNRGHGASGKLYDPTAYSAPIMAEDGRRLLDHLKIDKAHVMGYSMGARIAAFLAIAHPARVRSLVLAGLAANLIKGIGGAEEIAEALEAPSLADVSSPQARPFRVFAEQTKSDLKALAACIRSARQIITLEELARITAPALIVAGELDDTAGPVEPLVKAISGARGVTVPGRNHMSTVGDGRFKQAVLEFFQSVDRA
jgi:pimeloyl-ACP methyl ester carboxylesterase